MYRIQFAITIDDYENWSKTHKRECDASDTLSYGSYGDWVVNKLRAVMEEAGNKFINDNRDLFKVDQLS